MVGDSRLPGFVADPSPAAVPQFCVGRLNMPKLAQAVFVISGLAILIVAGASAHRRTDRHPSPSTVAAAPQTLWKHDWTVRVGYRTYGVCQSWGGSWALFLGSGCIDIATSVRYQQVATVLALLSAAVILSLGSVALLRAGRLTSREAQPHAAPNGGPGMQGGNSGAGGGPPSVS